MFEKQKGGQRGWSRVIFKKDLEKSGQDLLKVGVDGMRGNKDDFQNFVLGIWVDGWIIY